MPYILETSKQKSFRRMAGIIDKMYFKSIVGVVCVDVASSEAGSM